MFTGGPLPWISSIKFINRYYQSMSSINRSHPFLSSIHIIHTIHPYIASTYIIHRRHPWISSMDVIHRYNPSIWSIDIFYRFHPWTLSIDIIHGYYPLISPKWAHGGVPWDPGEGTMVTPQAGSLSLLGLRGPLGLMAPAGTQGSLLNDRGRDP